MELLSEVDDWPGISCHLCAPQRGRWSWPAGGSKTQRLATGMITKYLEFFKIYYCGISTSIEVRKIAAPAIVISVALTPKSDIWCKFHALDNGSSLGNANSTNKHGVLQKLRKIMYVLWLIWKHYGGQGVQQQKRKRTSCDFTDGMIFFDLFCSIFEYIMSTKSSKNNKKEQKD